MSSGPADTDDDARAAQFRAWRRMGSARCLELAFQMSDDARAITAAGIRHRHPDYDDDQVRWALYRLLLGDATFTAAFPAAPLLPP
jgi:hypothetical protein